MNMRFWSALLAVTFLLSNCRTIDTESQTNEAVELQAPLYASYFKCAHATKLPWADRDTPSYVQKWMVHADEDGREFGYLKRNDTGHVYYILTNNKAYSFRAAQISAQHHVSGIYRVKVVITNESDKNIASLSLSVDKEAGNDGLIRALLPFESPDFGYATSQQSSMQASAVQNGTIRVYAKQITEREDFMDLYKDLRDGFRDLDTALADALKGLNSWQKHGGSLTGMLSMLQDNLNLNTETAKELDGMLQGISMPTCGEFYGQSPLKAMHRNRGDIASTLNIKGDFYFKAIERASD